MWGKTYQVTQCIIFDTIYPNSQVFKKPFLESVLNLRVSGTGAVKWVLPVSCDVACWTEDLPDLMRHRAAGPQHKVFNHRPLPTGFNHFYRLLSSIAIYKEEKFICAGPQRASTYVNGGCLSKVSRANQKLWWLVQLMASLWAPGIKCLSETTTYDLHHI